jgi:hypothetical protein
MTFRELKKCHGGTEPLGQNILGTYDFSITSG